MAQAGLPHSALVGGNSVRSTILQSYVFNAGIHDPEISNILSYKYPQYYMTAMLDRLGSYEAVAQDTYSWFTMDRTRQSGTISALANGTTTSATIEVAEFVYSSPNLGYALVGDIFRIESGELAKVTAITVGSSDSSAQKLTVERLAGGSWSTSLILDTWKIGHMFTAFEEASSAPGTRLYLPTEEYNYTAILRRSFKISGSEFTNRTRIGDGSAWYWEKEDLEMKEFARDKEGLVMFGERASNSSSVIKHTKGIWQYAVDNGVSNGFVAATGVSETDIQDHIKDLLIQGVSNEILVLCGAQFLADFQRAMRDYAVNGAINFGNFGGNTVGLDFQEYKFMGKTMKVVYYELFDDTAMLPTPVASLSSSVVNFSNTSLWLDLGTDTNGKKLISLKYKEHDGQSRKFIHAYEVGMMNPAGQNGGQVSTGGDFFLVHYLSECGVEVRLSNRLGILKATS
ncbi:hypothetical protein LCGC14_0667720 [marine sediment metagenome]|uniref:Capsid protein n=1 Tax=marine sediment metagenome TaxID=412755 RepID=A0A0F9TZZ0_9ZZZZ